MRKNKKEVKDEIKEDAIEEVEEKDLEQNSSDEVEKKLNSEIEELKNQLLRLQADFINYKNRTEREKSNSIILANEDLILKLLPVLDNFNRAFTHANLEDDTIKGFVMIKDQFESVLKSETVEEIESDGAVFDPNFHNSVIYES